MELSSFFTLIQNIFLQKLNNNDRFYNFYFCVSPSMIVNHYFNYNYDHHLLDHHYDHY
jgi:hypothetical protein